MAKVHLDESAASVAVKPPEPREVVWLDDAPPPGAVLQGNEGTASWKFVAKPAPVFSGEKSHTQTVQGLNQHFFTVSANAGVAHRCRRQAVYLRLSRSEESAQGNHAPVQRRIVGTSGLLGRQSDRLGRRKESQLAVSMGPLPEVGKWDADWR